MPLPELAGGLPSNFEQAQKVFDQRVKAKFAVGTLESNLKAVVINQGFRLFPASSPSDFAMAVLERKESFLCLGRWTVRWRVKGDKLSEVWGVYGSLCV